MAELDTVWEEGDYQECDPAPYVWKMNDDYYNEVWPRHRGTDGTASGGWFDPESLVRYAPGEDSNVYWLVFGDSGPSSPEHGQEDDFYDFDVRVVESFATGELLVTGYHRFGITQHAITGPDGTQYPVPRDDETLRGDSQGVSLVFPMDLVIDLGPKEAISGIDFGNVAVGQVLPGETTGAADSKADDGDLLNIALSSLGATATAVSEGTYRGVTHPASSLVDGDDDTDWCSQWSMPAWIEVEFDKPYDIRQVAVEINHHQQTFSISLSTDGEEWEEVVSPRLSGNAPSTDGASYELFDVDPQMARFMRIDITTTTAPGSHIFQAIITKAEAYAEVETN